MAPRNSRDALLEKRRKIEAQLKALDARAREQQRKDDTRRKIILGGLVMAEIETDAGLRDVVRRLIEEKASDKDREFLAGWLAAAAQEAPEEGGAAAIPSAPTSPEPPQPEAKKSSLILPGQDQGGGADKPLSRPSIILRP